MGTIQKYILVDDDSISNLISNRVIEKAMGKVDIVTFSVPEEGLGFIRNNQAQTLQPTILFLDINMPTMSGWEFMKEFAKLSEEVKNSISVYIVSSSVNQFDIDEAESNRYVRGFFVKPLKKEMVSDISLV